MMDSEQLTLGIQLTPDYTFKTFITGSNGALVAELQSLPNTKNPYLYLWGKVGVGCSHLLQATCHSIKHQGGLACYLSLANYADYPTEILAGLEGVDCLCLDDIDTIVGRPDWEEAIFHLYNRLQSQQQLLIAGRTPPAQLALSLNDLRSRLTSGLIFQVTELSDVEKQDALILQAKERGLVLSRDVAKFILHHATRDMDSLSRILQLLDEASLSAQRALTRPFVKQVMGW